MGPARRRTCCQGDVAGPVPFAVMADAAPPPGPDHDTPPHRYAAALAGRIETSWQDRWEREGTFPDPQPGRRPERGLRQGGRRPKLYVLDMFPYPSGAGLHVGHPLGYIGTDVYARYQRMTGHNVIHTIGYDAFGCPPSIRRSQTGQHPRITTESNIATMRRQLRRLGLAHDPRRSISTIDEGYYRWTQWIFLQIFNAWYDTDADQARPIADLVAELEAGSRQPGEGTNPTGGRGPSCPHRAPGRGRQPPAGLRGRGPVNWCPGWDRAGQRGGHRRGAQRPRQLPGVPAAAEAVEDADHGLRRPAAGRPGPAGLARGHQADAAQLDRPVRGRPHHAGPGGPGIEVFPRVPTRPSAPPTWSWRRRRWSRSGGRLAGRRDAVLDGGHGTPAEAVAAYRRQAARPSEVERQAESREERRVPGHARHQPHHRRPIPVFIADYVLMGYGTGAIMAVPARTSATGSSPRISTCPSSDGPAARGLRGQGLRGRGPGHQQRQRRDQPGRPGRRGGQARHHRLAGGQGPGHRHRHDQAAGLAVQPQRFWGEPFPIVYDPDDGLPGRCRVAPAGSAAARRGLRPRHLRRTTTRPRSRCRQPPGGSTSPWTWARAPRPPA